MVCICVQYGRSIVTGKLKSKSQWGTKQRCNTNRGLKETAFSRDFSVGSPGQDGIVSLATKYNGIFARSCGCRLIHDISGFNATQTIPAVAKEASFEYVRYWDVVDPGNTENGGFSEGWFVFLRLTPADGHILHPSLACSLRNSCSSCRRYLPSPYNESSELSMTSKIDLRQDVVDLKHSAS